MKIPVGLFIASLGEQKVYYFSSTRLNTEIPHYFICLKRTNNDILIMSCCTSQFETVRRFIQTRNLPYETLVCIKPADSNPFTKETYIDCNNVHTFTIEEFIDMYGSDSVTYSGEISDNYYSQILTGIHKSPLIDLEIKEQLPIPD